MLIVTIGLREVVFAILCLIVRATTDNSYIIDREQCALVIAFT